MEFSKLSVFSWSSHHLRVYTSTIQFFFSCTLNSCCVSINYFQLSLPFHSKHWVKNFKRYQLIFLMNCKPCPHPWNGRMHLLISSYEGPSSDLVIFRRIQVAASGQSEDTFYWNCTSPFCAGRYDPEPPSQAALSLGCDNHGEFGVSLPHSKNLAMTSQLIQPQQLSCSCKGPHVLGANIFVLPKLESHILGSISTLVLTSSWVAKQE